MVGDHLDKILIVGGGIFGLTSAIVFGELGYEVVVVEKNYDVLLGATISNQNRVHHGFHYPRSIKTSEESIMGIKTFMEYYGESINNSFNKFYAISKYDSKTTSEDFCKFSKNINMDIIEKWPSRKILNRDNIDSCWLTKEPVFDYYKIREIIINRVSKCSNITIFRNSSIKRIVGNFAELDEDNIIEFDYLVNATYSDIPNFLSDMGYDTINSKFQLCILPILRLDRVRNFGITIMDGPFCSLMPKGFDKHKYILYHVKHSVNQEHIGNKKIDWMPIKNIVENDIIEKSKLYFPILNDMKLVDSWITTRIILPEQEIDDARPTLVMQNHTNVFTIFSGKITTCVDAANKLLSLIKNIKKNNGKD